jgi:uncharacterized protein YgiB involved in biofilm formation
MNIKDYIRIHHIFRIFSAITMVLALVALNTGTMVAAASPNNTDNSGMKAPRSFDECVLAGGDVREEDKGKTCTLSNSDGVFVKPKSDEKRACQNKCGDGVCQEIVCMAVGCPCPESTATCPGDCKSSETR